ncbi:MAG: VCBS repeat-containing protein, partial [Bacteroidetes bacterium]|nr:VCBS repeat-containing protein [Bacteroidota bacterium]
MKKDKLYITLVLPALILGYGCGGVATDTAENPNEQTLSEGPLFTLMSPEETGIDFTNAIQGVERMTSYEFVNIFNGGGVAIGDIDNDGLPDVYFTANSRSNKLYRNLGNMKFDDITDQAGVDGEGGWCSGVTMADVNGDGFLDIYVCRTYNDNNPNLRTNLLYINNGDLTFTEKGEEYGVNDDRYATQATFFDYDNDSDLDLYVGNYPREFIERNKLRLAEWNNPKMINSDHLYRNNGDGTFSNVTEEAGVMNYGYTLGLVAGDINGDGWIDLYVSNDHSEPDFYYLNNHDGTFTNATFDRLQHISQFGMGVDLADYNNDGLLDIVVLDMMAEDNYRQKTQMRGMDPKLFWIFVKIGWHYQYMRNTLQLNNGNGTFSEVGQFAGIDKTDWSWSALFADFDNSGHKDLVITNGYRKNVRDNDFIIKVTEKSKGSIKSMDQIELAKMMTSTKLRNYYYRNNGDLTFTDQTVETGLTDVGFSYGASYADLDMDGDLDLIISNLSDLAFVYKNNSESINTNNYLRVKLNGDGNNSHAFGAKVKIKIGDDIQFQELTATRGFQSSVESILHFGLGHKNSVDELTIIWPDGKQQLLSNVEANQLLILYQKDAVRIQESKAQPDPLMTDVTDEIDLDYVHTENEYDDYKTEILLPHRMSRWGPNIAVGDVNGDGLDDFFVGGASGQSGSLYIQDENAGFSRSEGHSWEKEQILEDIGALFFDADGDGDNDLYVVSGGNEFKTGSFFYQDRLYINEDGKFIKGMKNLPKMLSSGGCVSAGDYDKDGDLDLCVGGRQSPGQYPFPARSFILN